MIKAVIFDLDDTLIPEKEYIRSGYKEVAKKIKQKYKIDISENEIFNNLETEFNKDKKNVFNRVLRNYNIEFAEEDIKELIKTYREHKPDIKFYNDVISTIEELKKRNMKLGIITDGYLETQKTKLEAVNAYSMFDKIILTEELGRDYWKPHPKAFEIMKEFFDINYDEIVYVGDNPKKDFYIRKIYPIYTVRLLREQGIYKEEKYYGDITPCRTINRSDEIIEIINELNGGEN